MKADLSRRGFVRKVGTGILSIPLLGVAAAKRPAFASRVQATPRVKWAKDCAFFFKSAGIPWIYDPEDNCVEYLPGPRKYEFEWLKDCASLLKSADIGWIYEPQYNYIECLPGPKIYYKKMVTSFCAFLVGSEWERRSFMDEDLYREVFNPIHSRVHKEMEEKGYRYHNNFLVEFNRYYSVSEERFEPDCTPVDLKIEVVYKRKVDRPGEVLGDIPWLVRLAKDINKDINESFPEGKEIIIE